LRGWKPIAGEVKDSKNLENILKSDLGYRELTKIITSPDYLD
jgi:hypothetical protein